MSTLLLYTTKMLPPKGGVSNHDLGKVCLQTWWDTTPAVFYEKDWLVIPVPTKEKFIPRRLTKITHDFTNSINLPKSGYLKFWIMRNLFQGSNLPMAIFR